MSRLAEEGSWTDSFFSLSSHTRFAVCPVILQLHKHFQN
jgi:hypothetical protein